MQASPRSDHRRRGLRVLLVLPLAASAVAALAGPASAHSEFAGSDPAVGARLTSVPEQLTLTFDDGVDPRLARVALTVGDRPALDLPAQVAGNQVTVPVPAAAQPDGAAAPWQVAYRIISADGHPVSGAVDFTVAAASSSAAPSSTAPSSTAPSSAVPSSAAGASGEPSPSPVSDTRAVADEGTGTGWSWLAGVTALVALAGGVALAVRRRQSSPS